MHTEATTEAITVGDSLKLRECFMKLSHCVIVQKTISLYDDVSYSTDGWSTGSDSPVSDASASNSEQESAPSLLFDKSNYRNGEFKAVNYGSSTRWNKAGTIGLRTIMFTIKIPDVLLQIVWPHADQIHFLNKPFMRLVREKLFYIKQNDLEYVVRVLCRDLHRFPLPAVYAVWNAVDTPTHTEYRIPNYQIEIFSVGVALVRPHEPEQSKESKEYISYT